MRSIVLAFALLFVPVIAFADIVRTPPPASDEAMQIAAVLATAAGLWIGLYLFAAWLLSRARTAKERGIDEDLREARSRHPGLLLAIAVLLFASPASAEPPAAQRLAPVVRGAGAAVPAPVVAQPAPLPVVLPVPVTLPAAPAPSEVERAALVIAGIRAGFLEAQAGVQAAPILKSWTESKAGQVVMGCIAGAIIVTSAAGAAAGVIVAVK